MRAMSARANELERIARRINWLVRYRRPIAILLAAVAAFALMHHFTGWLPRTWPGGHMVVTTMMLGTVCWYAMETMLGMVIAFWETAYSKLTRRVTLPPARALRRK
jgi:ABC-type uncharacterized transport system permease subunit